MAETTITEVPLLIAIILVSVSHVVTEGFGCDHLLEGHELTRMGHYKSASDTVIFTNKSVIVCTQRQCCVISNDKLQLSFPNTFKNVSFYIRETNLPYHTRIKAIPEKCATRERTGKLQRSSVRRKRATRASCDHLPPSDGDWCCSTRSGWCNSEKDKSCQQQYTAQSLLAWNKDTHDLRFELFNIPTYCSCINGN